MENEERSLNSKSSRESGDDESPILDSWDTGDGGESGAAVAQLERNLEQLKEKKQKEQRAKIQREKEEAMVSSSTDGGTADSIPGLVPPPTVLKILRRPQSSGNLNNQSSISVASSENQDSAISDLCTDFSQIRPTIGGTVTTQNGAVLKQKILKPLEEREKAYAEARQRIFGDKGSFEETLDDTEEIMTQEAIAALAQRQEVPPSESPKEVQPPRKDSKGNTPGILKISKKDTVVEPQPVESPKNQTVKVEGEKSVKLKSRAGQQIYVAGTNSNSNAKKKNKKKGNTQNNQQQQPQQQHFFRLPTQKILPQSGQSPRAPNKAPVSVMSMPDLSRPPPVFPPPHQMGSQQPRMPQQQPDYSKGRQQGPQLVSGGEYGRRSTVRFPVSGSSGSLAQMGVYVGQSSGGSEVPYGCPPPAFYPSTPQQASPRHSLSMPEQRMRYENQQPPTSQMAPLQLQQVQQARLLAGTGISHQLNHQYPPAIGQNQRLTSHHQAAAGGGMEQQQQVQMFGQQNPVRVVQSNQIRGQMGRGY